MKFRKICSQSTGDPADATAAMNGLKPSRETFPSKFDLLHFFWLNWSHNPFFARSIYFTICYQLKFNYPALLPSTCLWGSGMAEGWRRAKKKNRARDEGWTTPRNETEWGEMKYAIDRSTTSSNTMMFRQAVHSVLRWVQIWWHFYSACIAVSTMMRWRWLMRRCRTLYHLYY